MLCADITCRTRQKLKHLETGYLVKLMLNIQIKALLSQPETE